MDMKALLLSPNGRINRSRFWLTSLACSAVMMVFYIPFVLTLQPNQQSITGTQVILLIPIIVLALLLTVVSIMLGIKRFHDRDKSGWWICIQFVPFIGPIWYLVECGFLRGTPGRNRFGADPLGPQDDIVQVFGGPERTPIR